MSDESLRVWLDFWELSGAVRVNIIRPDGTTLEGVPAIIFQPDTGIEHIEVIDLVRVEDKLRMVDGSERGIAYVAERNVGDFEFWLITPTPEATK